MYLLDTNVLSELSRSRPDRHVVDWLHSAPAESTFLSVLTIGEIVRGIATRRRDNPKHAAVLETWLERVRSDYAERLLPVDPDIAVRWGALVDAHPQFPIDMVIAATALERGLTVVTRNVGLFQIARVPVVNPSIAQARPSP